jgi:hypothetical protein
MTSQALTRPNNPQLYNQGNDVNASTAFIESSSEFFVNGKGLETITIHVKMN